MQFVIMKCGFCKDGNYYGKLVEKGKEKSERCPNCKRLLVVVKQECGVAQTSRGGSTRESLSLSWPYLATGSLNGKVVQVVLNPASAIKQFGDRLMVGLLTLDQYIEVRILVPEPNLSGLV